MKGAPGLGIEFNRNRVFEFTREFYVPRGKVEVRVVAVRSGRHRSQALESKVRFADNPDRTGDRE